MNVIHITKRHVGDTHELGQDTDSVENSLEQEELGDEGQGGEAPHLQDGEVFSAGEISPEDQ